MKMRVVCILTVLFLAISLGSLLACAAEALPFSDVAADAWYADAVRYVNDKGIMRGEGGAFSPDAAISRAMLVTTLWREAKEPAATKAAQFADTVADSWYAEALSWGVEKGIITGYEDNRFGPDDAITREQLAAILWRAADKPQAAAGGMFADQAKIAGWAAEAVAWVKSEGIMSGKEGNNFDPLGTATRAETAAIIYRRAQAAEGTKPIVGGGTSGGSSSGGSSGGGSSSSTQVKDDLVRINGGAFQMGSPANEPERSSDEVQHRVTVGSFYMAKTEVTQKDYRALMGSNPSEFKGDDLPVTDITWYDAIEYCNKLSESRGLTPCYTVSGTTVSWNRAANGYRLPTEAEWEYAARANTATPFSFGDYVHNSDANCYNAYGYNNDASGNWVNGADSYLRTTVAADSYAANAFGLYNMHGNAAEWVWDWYGDYGSGTAADPTGPQGGSAKVVRGGGWNDHPKHIRSAYRGAQPADIGLYSIGMRPVRNAEAAGGTVASTYTAKAEAGTGRTLIVYFSQTGNTEGLAKLIHEISGADIFRLERQTPYSSNHNGEVLYGEALNELRAEAVPELKAYPDIAKYDTILLGYCNWWSSVPASVRSLLMHEDFSGKTIVPFCSMGGGRFGQTISAIAKLAPNSVIKEGLEVTYSSYDRDEIKAWLDNSLTGQTAPEPQPQPEEGGKTLVAYFSCTNNTGNIAKHIKTALGDAADIYEITPETPYTAADLNYNTDCRANREQNDASARPAISGGVADMAQYDTVFIGYPIWWGRAPKIIHTFMESYDWAGKTVIPFCTSGGSGYSDSGIKELGEGSTWLTGRRFSGGASAQTVADWVAGFDLEK